jgi:hypothetical protein
MPPSHIRERQTSKEMRHVFVETNWLVAIAAPNFNRPPAALELLTAAKEERIHVYLPACCIGEAKKTIRQKYQPKEADRLLSYIRWALEQKILSKETADSAREMLSTFVAQVRSELLALSETLREITNAKGVHIMHLNDAVLDMALELHFKEVELSELIALF